MARFNTKALLDASPSLIPEIVSRIEDEFKREGYMVAIDELGTGGYDISITRGDIFKAVLGMKTALKVTLLPRGNQIDMEAGIGVWEQYAVPTIISMLVFWPVLITQIWGMVEQAKLDDRVLAIAKDVISHAPETVNENIVSATKRFCPYCGADNGEQQSTCIVCGKPIN